METKTDFIYKRLILWGQQVDEKESAQHSPAYRNENLKAALLQCQKIGHPCPIKLSELITVFDKFWNLVPRYHDSANRFYTIGFFSNDENGRDLLKRMTKIWEVCEVFIFIENDILFVTVKC